MKRWIERVLNVQPGDLGRGALLCTCLFLVISSYVIGKVAGAALFLSRFQAKQLAYADISSSVTCRPWWLPDTCWSLGGFL